MTLGTVLLTTQWHNDWWSSVWRAWAAPEIDVVIVVDVSGLALQVGEAGRCIITLHYIPSAK